MRIRKPTYPLQFAYLALAMPAQAGVGLVLFFASTSLYPHYAALPASWGGDSSPGPEDRSSCDVG